jgi:predicted porin
MSLLGRYGLRRYNQEFSERNLDFWTIGPHLEWTIVPAVKLGVSYHFERGLADGRNQPRYEDDVSYINHYGSIDLDFELSERFSFSTAFHYERNNWTSSLQEDERNGAHENVYQGEAILSYQISEALKTYTGVQYSSRKENFEVDAATNLNVGLGLTAKF